MNKCTVKQMCTKCMVQNADNQNCWCRLRCCLNVSSESASATSCGRAFQAGMVRGRNAYLNASTTGWKRWNCMVWPLVVFCRRCTGWYSCGTSTSPFVILYIMVSLLWSLRVCRGSHPRSDTIADTETGGLLRRKGMFFTNRAARRWVISSLSIYFCWCGSQTLEQYSSLGRTIAL